VVDARTIADMFFGRNADPNKIRKSNLEPVADYMATGAQNAGVQATLRKCPHYPRLQSPIGTIKARHLFILHQIDDPKTCGIRDCITTQHS
jgi:hypothetical protein